MKVTNPSSESNTQFSSENSKAAIECFRCGVCCIKYQVRLSIVEAQRISAHLGLTFEEFLKNYTDHRWIGPGSLLKQSNGKCAFLDFDSGGRTNNCRIQCVKPDACREWTAGLLRSECQEGLVKYWQLIINSSGQLEGTEEKLEAFQTFLRSLR